ncbi:uncharacterized protein EV154DRAFT_519378 [Mucor mucedo]|uniref:uncharacterized protein n=1 Tax=Mucor mucedo TaxID=29922 RepID=UPI00221FF413|nr:uncharacterized protein EV154DRAFT_519378 [Mucor mucedo]KAI7887880.1 hypothetical protein EV154DRAFT_519378 [Mucor mucedo]
MGYNEKVCCCLPVRIGVLIMSFLIFCIYFVATFLMFYYRNDLTQWSILQQNVDTPLTLDAFNGVFYAFVTAFITYAVVSIVGMVAIVLQHRRLVRIYHVANWFFVLLLFTTTLAFWTYLKVKQDVYVNDCQELFNVYNNATINSVYTPIQIPGKQIVAGGSDKSECINFIKKLVIGSGVCVFICNILQLYWARSIGKYATSLKRHYQHQRLEVRDDDMLSIRSD